jgi:ethanolamine kinase
LIQASVATGSIEFDYAGYAEKRFAEYWAWKEVENGILKGKEMSLREQRWMAEI